MSNCKSNRFNQSERRCRQNHHGGQFGRKSGTEGQKVLLIDVDAQVNLTMSLGYNRPDDLPVTLSTIMQDIIEDNPIDVQKSGKVAAAMSSSERRWQSLARNKAPKIELTPYDELFETDQSREEAALSKIRIIPLAEIDEFLRPPVQGLNGLGHGAAC